MKKMNLLYIGNKLSKHGNTATSIETLGAFLEEEGYKVYYASSKKNKVSRMLHMIYKTFKRSRVVNYVLIDTYSTQNFWFAFVISQLCRVLRIKYIAKLHGGDLPNRLAKSPFFCNLIFKNAYKITAPSGYLMNAFELKYPANIMYIPNTIEINNYPLIQKEYTVPKILWVRSFSSIYNPKMAIEVAANLKEKFPDVTLCMIGPDKENLIDECKKYAEKRNVEVEFTGKLSKKKWIKRSQEFNIFINTTHFDNTPISVIEAMALGIPVVSTNVGGIPFLLKDTENALLVNDSDAIAMSKAIEKIMCDSKLRSTIITNGRALVEDFDWGIVKQKWIDILI
jgi:L-malate glycosyltransferase